MKVLQQEYSQPPIFPSPHFRWVVNTAKTEYNLLHYLLRHLLRQCTEQFMYMFPIAHHMRAIPGAPSHLYLSPSIMQSSAYLYKRYGLKPCIIHGRAPSISPTMAPSYLVHRKSTLARGSRWDYTPLPF